MLRAKIAGRVVELIGCETMTHAADLARFSCGPEPTDCRVEVRCCDTLVPPDGEQTGSYGAIRCLKLPNGREVLYAQNGQWSISFDEHYTDVLVLLHKQLPRRDIRHYLYVLRAVSWHLLLHDGCILHSAGLQMGGRGVALCGKSGVGKSTMTRHLQTRMPSCAVLCEDMPALTETSTGWILHGTPFCGKDTQCKNAAAPLAGIVLLRQARENRLSRPSTQEAMFELLSAVPRPVHSATLSAIAAERLLRLSQQIPLLLFENDGTAAAGDCLLTRLCEEGWI